MSPELIVELCNDPTSDYNDTKHLTQLFAEYNAIESFIALYMRGIDHVTELGCGIGIASQFSYVRIDLYDLDIKKGQAHTIKELRLFGQVREAMNINVGVHSSMKQLPMTFDPHVNPKTNLYLLFRAYPINRGLVDPIDLLDSLNQTNGTSAQLLNVSKHNRAPTQHDVRAAHVMNLGGLHYQVFEGS